MNVNVNKKIVEFFATGFFVGKLPFAPGTYGTLVAVPIAYLLLHCSALVYMASCVVVLLFAVFVSDLHERNTGAHDMSEIVIDEIIGYLITMTWLPLTWQSFVAGFVLFRIFDIVKPPPIRQMDQRIEGGLGTVLDDVAAGLVSSIILQIVYAKTTWLGVQLHG